MIPVGTAVRDITPPAGLPMAGFAARTRPAEGTHDPLTVRALAVGDTVLVTADLIGLDAATCARVRRAAPVPARKVVIHATHTHGGPLSMPGRLGGEPDPSYLARVEAALGEAIATALATRRPARLSFGWGGDPDIARNRRHPDGPVDRALPVLVAHNASGAPLAILVNYACHPVVLGADNLLWTADYPHFVRTALEREMPGAAALFLTGCVGDLNTGHSAAASLSLAPHSTRSFPEAERIGEMMAAAALAADLGPLDPAASAHEAEVALPFARRENDPAALARAWEREAADADPVRRALLACWIDWARRISLHPAPPLPARVSHLDWGGLALVGLPGEIFAATALSLRQRIPGQLMLAGFCEDNPGYIPPAEEYRHGGYEVDEAHRFYGMPATFAPGAAETLADAAISLAPAQAH